MMGERSNQIRGPFQYAQHLKKEKAFPKQSQQRSGRGGGRVRGGGEREGRGGEGKAGKGTGGRNREIRFPVTKHMIFQISRIPHSDKTVPP